LTQKVIKRNKIKEDILSKDDFLRILNWAIKPSGQETLRTLEKTDSCDCNEMYSHSDNSEDNQRTPSDKHL
jgi:hypothetical protein